MDKLIFIDVAPEGDPGNAEIFGGLCLVKIASFQLKGQKNRSPENTILERFSKYYSSKFPSVILKLQIDNHISTFYLWFFLGSLSFYRV